MSDKVTPPSSNYFYIGSFLPSQSSAKEIISAIVTPIFKYLVDCFSKISTYCFGAKPTKSVEDKKEDLFSISSPRSSFTLRRRQSASNPSGGTPFSESGGSPETPIGRLIQTGDKGTPSLLNKIQK